MLSVNQKQAGNARHSVTPQDLEDEEIVLLFGTRYTATEQASPVVEAAFNTLPAGCQARRPDARQSPPGGSPTNRSPR